MPAPARPPDRPVGKATGCQIMATGLLVSLGAGVLGAVAAGRGDIHSAVLLVVTGLVLGLVLIVIGGRIDRKNALDAVFKYRAAAAPDAELARCGRCRALNLPGARVCCECGAPLDRPAERRR